MGTVDDGPGRLTRAFDIDRRLNRCDLTLGESLWFEDRGEIVPTGLLATIRVSVWIMPGVGSQALAVSSLTTETSKPRRTAARLSARKNKKGKPVYSFPVERESLRNRELVDLALAGDLGAEVWGSILICGPCTVRQAACALAFGDSHCPSWSTFCFRMFGR